jgi:hypothetical protein
MVGRFHPFYRPQRPLGRVAVYLYSVFRLEGGEGSASRPDRFSPGEDPVPIVQGTEWCPGPVWTGAENLAPVGIRSPDRPARSQSLYRPSYKTVVRKIIYERRKYALGSANEAGLSVDRKAVTKKAGRISRRRTANIYQDPFFRNVLAQ